MKTKLSLNELKITSFVTSLKNIEKVTINGGADNILDPMKESIPTTIIPVTIYNIESRCCFSNPMFGCDIINTPSQILISRANGAYCGLE